MTESLKKAVRDMLGDFMEHWMDQVMVCSGFAWE